MQELNLQELVVRADEVRPGDIATDLPVEVDYIIREVSRIAVTERTPAEIAAVGGWVNLAGDTGDGYYRRAYGDEQAYYAAPDQMVTVLREVELPRVTLAGVSALINIAHQTRFNTWAIIGGSREINAAKKLERDGLIERWVGMHDRNVRLTELGRAWVQALSLAESAVGAYFGIADSHTSPTGVRRDAKLHAAAAVRRAFGHLTQEQAELTVIQAHCTQASIVKVIRDSGYIR